MHYEEFDYEEPPGTLREERVTAGIYGMSLTMGSLMLLGVVHWVVGGAAVLFGVLTWLKMR